MLPHIETEDEILNQKHLSNEIACSGLLNDVVSAFTAEILVSQLSMLMKERIPYLTVV